MILYLIELFEATKLILKATGEKFGKYRGKLFFVDSVWNIKQDGRLAPAYFSQEHKYFDQHLPTVKNETIV